MNKILVINNKIKDFSEDDVTITGNHIIFRKNGDYTIEYINSNKIDLTIELKEDCFIKLFEFSNNKDITINNQYLLAKNSNLLLFKFYANNNTHEKIIFDLNDENAKLNYHFSSLATTNDIYHLIINHHSQNTRSNIINRSLTKENASIDFTIDDFLPQGVKNCYLNQDTKIIVLGNNNSTIRPNMYIEEVDVEARHASSIGKFSQDEIFYLMTRGINYDDAIKLLIKGLIFSNLVVSDEIEEKILTILNS